MFHAAVNSNNHSANNEWQRLVLTFGTELPRSLMCLPHAYTSFIISGTACPIVLLVWIYTVQLTNYVIEKCDMLYIFRFNRVSAWVNSYIEGMILTHKWKRFPQVCEHHAKRVTLGVRHARGGAVVLEENHDNVFVISNILSTYRIFFWTWSWQRPLSTIWPALHVL